MKRNRTTTQKKVSAFQTAFIVFILFLFIIALAACILFCISPVKYFTPYTSNQNTLFNNNEYTNPEQNAILRNSIIFINNDICILKINDITISKNTYFIHNDGISDYILINNELEKPIRIISRDLIVDKYGNQFVSEFSKYEIILISLTIFLGLLLLILIIKPYISIKLIKKQTVN